MRAKENKLGRRKKKFIVKGREYDEDKKRVRFERGSSKRAKVRASRSRGLAVGMTVQSQGRADGWRILSGRMLLASDG